MATILETINQVLTYENEPERRRELLKNTFELTEEQVAALMQAIESIPEDYTQLIAVVEGLVSSYGALENTVEGLSENVGDITDDLENKADKTGTYENLTAGNALQLLATDYTEDQTPYLFRTSGGSADIGNREEDVIIGGSVAWNQLSNIGDICKTRTARYAGMLVSSDGTALKVNLVNGHKYLLSFVQPSGCALYTQAVSVDGTNYFPLEYKSYASPLADTTISRIVQAGGTISQCNIISAVSKLETTETEYALKNVQLIDLTQMFNSTIADLVYSKEQTTAGSGVSWLKSMGFFVKNFSAYNPGGLESVHGLLSHDMVGFNQWDEQWELGYINSVTGVDAVSSNCIRSKGYISILPGTTYYAKGSGLSLRFYDSEKNFIASANAGITNNTFVTPSNAYYLRFFMPDSYGTTYKNDICINLSWSGYRNGEYEAYTKHSYPLDSTLTLRGIPKVNASGELYYDGDEYLPDGTVNRRYAEVDLGTLNWSYLEGLFSVTKPSDCKAGASSDIGNVRCAKYVTAPRLDMPDKTVALTANYIFVSDSAYTDAETFKTAMSGVMLIYEVATPTTETATPYASPQIVDDFGTEEYVIDSSVSVPIPPGHVTRYPANLRDKLQHLPDLSSDGDGYYLIQQTGTDMILVAFRIPRAPETDGTYTLKCTVSGGSPLYEWESVT